uniref:PB1-like domain-containing protein n=1 Tax=Chenopodium quinoa TaxID=63459 RepID=A0A803N1H8_CHEQI
MGGKGRTFQVFPNELCYWELVHFGKKCGDYSNIAGLYYLVRGMSLADRLRKISGDAEVLEMGEIVMKHRSVDVYVLHSLKEPHLSPENPTPSVSYSSPKHISSPISENIPPPKPTEPKKLTQKGSTFTKYEWEDSRPESPLTLKELCGFSTKSEDVSDLEFVPDEKQDDEGIDVELEVEDDYFEVDEGLDRVDLVTATSSDQQEIDPTYASTSSASVQHHSTTAQPTHLGRGPSVRETRGGRGRGRGRGHVPIGFGVIFK